MLKKNVLRMIRTSLGRYLAILAIIALGTGFFAGLKVARPAILKACDTYAKDLALYDFRLVSTLGLTDEDVEAFSEMPGVTLAVGAISVDALWDIEASDAADASETTSAADPAEADGTESTGAVKEVAYHVHSYHEGINGLEVTEGRLPEQPSECVLDAFYAPKSLIGTKVTLSGHNKKSTRELFAQSEYTVVGLVNAVTYMNFERGSTSLAGGKVSGFMYLMPEAFDMDYVTEIYLKVDTDAPICSAEYEQDVDGLRPAMEALLSERADLRYEKIMAEGQEKIDKAQAKVDKKKKALKKAQKEVDQGWKDYRSEAADSQRELESARNQIDQSEQEIRDGWDKLEKMKKNPMKNIPEVKEAIKKTQKEIKDGEKAYNKGVKELPEAKKKAEAEFAAKEKELNAAQKKVDAQQKKVDAKKEEVEQLLSDMRQKINPWDPDYDAKLAAYKKTQKEYEDELDAAQKKVDEAQKQVTDGFSDLDEAKKNAQAEFKATQDKLDKTKQKIADAKKLLKKMKKDPLNNVPGLKKQLTQYENKLKSSEKALEKAKKNYKKASQKAQKALEKARQKLLDAEDQIEEAKVKITDAEKKVEEAKDDLAKIKYPSLYTLDRNSNIGSASLENDTNILNGIARVFPVFFFLVAAMVCITTMTRMVGEQRTQNGILKAMGYSDRAIIGQYLFYAGSASLMGCILGFLIGSKLMPMVLWKVYGVMYTVTRPVPFVLDLPLFAGSASLYLICALGVTYLVCRRDLAECAASLMRPKAPAAGKRILLERIGGLWSSVPFLHKVTIRNIFLYKKRMLMMILGIGGCTALLLTGFGIRDSIQPIVRRQYEEISLYDARIAFDEEMDPESQESFLKMNDEEIKDAVFVYTENVDVMIGTTSKEIDMVAFDRDPYGFVDLHRGWMPSYYPEKGQVVVNYRFAQAENLSVGDTIKVKCEGAKAMELEISDIFDNYVGDVIYVDMDSFDEEFASGTDPNSAYVLMPSGYDVHEAGALLMNAEHVAAVTLSADEVTRINGILQNMNYVILIVLVCAGALAFIVLYNLTNITITERTREIATLGVLGFYQREQSSYVYRENMILTLISILAGIPMGIALLRYVMAQIKISSIYFGWTLSPFSLLWSVLLTIIFSLVVDIALAGKMHRINMAEAMKAVE